VDVTLSVTFMASRPMSWATGPSRSRRPICSSDCQPTLRTREHAHHSDETITQWGHVFSDDTIAAAVLDRVLHHTHALVIQGDSYRLQHEKQAGPLGSSKPATERMGEGSVLVAFSGSGLGGGVDHETDILDLNEGRSHEMISLLAQLVGNTRIGDRAQARHLDADLPAAEG
jgi:hypothetical protein